MDKKSSITFCCQRRSFMIEKNLSFTVRYSERSDGSHKLTRNPLAARWLKNSHDDADLIQTWSLPSAKSRDAVLQYVRHPVSFPDIEAVAVRQQRNHPMIWVKDGIGHCHNKS